MGSIMLIFGAMATIFSIRLLIEARNLTGYLSYEDMTVKLFGHKMGVLVEVNIIVFCFGTTVAYIVAVGDILDPVLSILHAPVWLDRRFAMYACALKHVCCVV
jgi:amino acid permease